jgi:hypothetical protein
MQAPQGIDRPRRAGTIRVDAGDCKPVVAGDRRLAQRHAVLDPRISLDRLVRRLAYGHEQHALEVELHERLLRADQMADVRRVEGPAQDADAQGVSPGPGPCRRPGT